jgi:hypothetical protein
LPNFGQNRIISSDIEDSAGGVIAGRSAGATVNGLLAAGHIRDGYGAVLADAGAHHVVRTYSEAEAVVRTLMNTEQGDGSPSCMTRRGLTF